MNSSLDMDVTGEPRREWYCLLCSVSGALNIGKDLIAVETAKCSMSERTITDVLASVLGKRKIQPLEHT